MSTRIIDQTESERILHRALYILKYFRAMLLHMHLVLLSVLLYSFGNIEGLYPLADGMIGVLKKSMAPGKAEGLSTFVLAIAILTGIFLWIYQSIVGVWRRSLKVQSAFLILCALLFPFQAASVLLFSIGNLAPTYVGLLVLDVAFTVFVAFDMAVALQAVSRTPETSVFRATLDSRLTSGSWNYLNKLLDLPRTPFRSVNAVVAYVLAVLGTVLLASSINSIMSGSIVPRDVAELEAACGLSGPEQCAPQSAVWARDIFVWLIISLVGLKFGALIQSISKAIGGISVTDAIKHADGRFILYLRPFHADSVILPRPRLPALSHLLTLRPFPARIEEELFDVADGYLPLIAVGVPSDKNRKSGDRAHREYLTDSKWQQFVAENLNLADSIVVVVSDTEGVRWETSKIIESGHAPKTLFLFDPLARDAAIWDRLGALLAASFVDAHLVPSAFRFQGRPLGVYFNGGDIVEIQNSNWSATSYRSAFSVFLAERMAG